MPELVQAFPVLASLDIARSLEFYEHKLGFRVVIGDRLDFAVVARDQVELHFWKCDDPEIPKQTSCHVRVRDIDALYAELEPHGVVHPHGALEDKPWGLREFPILDGDGNLIVFTQQI